MINIIVGILLLLSSIIVLVSSIGIWRFKNLYARMHVLTKVSSLGVLLLLIGINLYFFDWYILLKTAVIFGVLVFLSPVAAHVIARVARDIEISNSKAEEKLNSKSKTIKAKK